jgi:guanosine-3',5'-bis(diphosphate) 3'-pyrophosphohydrolase
MDQKLLAAIDLAAKGHALQHRKYDGLPYVNQIIEVLNIMMYGKITDIDALIAAVLHDSLENTDISRHEIKHKFGNQTLRLIDEVTEDKSMVHQRRRDRSCSQCFNGSTTHKVGRSYQ